MAAEREAGVEGERAMLEQRRHPIGDGRSKEALGLAGLERLALEKRNCLVEDGDIRGGVDVVGDRERQPRAIVGDPGAHALAGMRQPPMLHVAFGELPRRRAQQMLARQQRLRRRERHAVLQLIAKAIGAARLVESGPRPEAAAQVW